MAYAKGIVNIQGVAGWVALLVTVLNLVLASGIVIGIGALLHIGWNLV